MIFKLDITKIGSGLHRSALWIAISYGVIVGLWILVSSDLVLKAMPDGIEFEPGGVRAWAGWFFVVTSSWLLYLLVIKSLSAVRRSEEAVRVRGRAIEASANGIIITDPSKQDNPIVYTNPAFERITGYADSEVLGKNCRFLIRDDREQPGIDAMRVAIREERECHVVMRNYRKDGSLFWNSLYLAPVRDESNRVTHFIGVQNDITEIKSYQNELEHQASHDILTGLPNRHLLNDRLKQAMAQTQRQGGVVAVAFVDLDGFKLINDTLGHNAGDQLLRTVAERLQACLRPFDTVARYGGDEFIVVVHDNAGGESISGLWYRILASISKPFQLDKRELFITCSIGVSLYPTDGSDIQTLIKNADAAMFQAKAHGRNNVHFYTAEMNTKLAERLSLAADLHRALERNELVLQYQPQIDFRSGVIVGAEALLRWQHPTRGLVSPALFIPVAEETGLILPIGTWVIRTACTQAREWLQAGATLPTMSVNVSVRQFMDKDFVESLREILGHTRLDAQTLELEVTESLIMNNADEFVATLKKLKGVGVKLAIDDFGTGYSSLNHLKRMPVDRLKLDQSFVRDVNKNPESATIAEVIINLGHNLKLKVIAEGVESAAQAEFLRQRGCDEFQGHYFSRPMPPDQFLDLLKRRQQPILSSDAVT